MGATSWGAGLLVAAEGLAIPRVRYAAAVATTAVSTTSTAKTVVREPRTACGMLIVLSALHELLHQWYGLERQADHRPRRARHRSPSGPHALPALRLNYDH